MQKVFLERPKNAKNSPSMSPKRKMDASFCRDFARITRNLRVGNTIVSSAMRKEIWIPFCAVVGLMVLAALGSWVLLAPTANMTNAHHGDALVSLRMIEVNLKRFEMANGRMPTVNEGLQALVAKPASPDLQQWLQMLKELPLDPWGHSFQYVVPSPDGKMNHGVYSTGPDGITRSNGNDPDDINTWAQNLY